MTRVISTNSRGASGITKFRVVIAGCLLSRHYCGIKTISATDGNLLGAEKVSPATRTFFFFVSRDVRRSLPSRSVQIGVNKKVVSSLARTRTSATMNRFSKLGENGECKCERVITTAYNLIRRSINPYAADLYLDISISDSALRAASSFRRFAERDLCPRENALGRVSRARRVRVTGYEKANRFFTFEDRVGVVHNVTVSRGCTAARD